MKREEKVLEYLYFWDRPISPGLLRKQLEMKHSTLNSVLKRLEGDGLVFWEKYGSVQLTEQGITEAAHLSKHHFIVEKFLTDILDLAPDEAHKEALHLAPHINCVVIDAICQKMNIPEERVDKSFCKERNYLENQK